MENLLEPSTAFSFTSSSYLSNGTSSCNISASSSREAGSNTEIVSLSRLSSNLEKLLLNSEFDCTDAEIIVEGVSVGVHRCILSARSKFFHELFSRENGSSSRQERRPKYDINDLVPNGKVGHEAFKIFLSYVYTGKLKSSPPEVSTCVDPGCAHDACRPAVIFAVELMYASSVFQIAELVSLFQYACEGVVESGQSSEISFRKLINYLSEEKKEKEKLTGCFIPFQRRLLNFVDKAPVEDVIPILQVAYYCKLSQLLNHCIQRVARSNLDSVSIEKEVPQDASEEIKGLRVKFQPDEAMSAPMDPLREKQIGRIHKALDSDDVELVKLLLSESDITLDDANALHYASAYCDSKIVAELLELDLANINLKNARGYTALHVAAIRREPTVIVSLLSKGASVSEMTADGQCAVSICRRLTRAKDYYAKTEHGQESNKDRVCIDILEREMRRSPMIGEEYICSPIMADDLNMKLLYLENRVAFAKLLFPTEAKVAMKIAHAEVTSEFAGLSAPENINGTLREVDLNETPSGQHKRLRSRMDALIKTVELGRRYFPLCSQVLDKFLEDDLPDLFYLQRGTPEEQKVKRLRFCELKDEVHKAFTKDKAESTTRSGFSSSSSSSTSLMEGVKQKASRKS